jgi:hypothetical protein
LSKDLEFETWEATNPNGPLVRLLEPVKREWFA